MGRRKVDWSEVEPLYRAGVLSVSEIARQFDVTETAVRKHAKQHKWKRDLAAKVRAKTTQKLIEDLADGSKDGSNGSNPQRARESEEETTERAALTQVTVVRQHKTIIGDGLDLAIRMLSELKATTTHVGELEAMLDDDKTKRAGMYRAISVPTRITALRDFATACRTLVGLERQAFSIVEDKEPPPAPLPEPRTLEELRQTLLAQMEEFGLSPFDLTEPIGSKNSGVSNRTRGPRGAS
jgi:hypothetical protein